MPRTHSLISSAGDDLLAAVDVAGRPRGRRQKPL